MAGKVIATAVPSIVIDNSLGLEMHRLLMETELLRHDIQFDTQPFTMDADINNEHLGYLEDKLNRSCPPDVAFCNNDSGDWGFFYICQDCGEIETEKYACECS